MEVISLITGAVRLINRSEDKSTFNPNSYKLISELSKCSRSELNFNVTPGVYSSRRSGSAPDCSLIDSPLQVNYTLWV